MEKIKLNIIDLTPSQLQSGSFTLLLAEAKGDRKLPIIIGLNEAQAIAMELEKIVPTRPLTHDLFKNFAKSFDFSVEEIQISDISEGVFYSKIICTDGIRQKSIDARPSDAVAIAVRFEAPIYTNNQVLSEAGISNEDIEEEEVKPSKEVPVNSPKSLNELKKALENAINNEEYEKAAKIRDEIDKNY